MLYWHECLWQFLACESLHVCTVCIWNCGGGGGGGGGVGGGGGCTAEALTGLCFV